MVTFATSCCHGNCQLRFSFISNFQCSNGKTDIKHKCVKSLVLETEHTLQFGKKKKTTSVPAYTAHHNRPLAVQWHRHRNKSLFHWLSWKRQGKRQDVFWVSVNGIFCARFDKISMATFSLIHENTENPKCFCNKCPSPIATLVQDDCQFSHQG